MTINIKTPSLRQTLIAGGGIGGLTAALSLKAQANLPSQIWESTASFEPVGAGIQLSPNAMAIFKKLGLDSAIRASANQPESIEAKRGDTGRSLFNIKLKTSANKHWSNDYLHIHRAALHRVLSNAVEQVADISIQHKAHLDSWDLNGTELKVTSKTGQSQQTDLLIGADGLHSRTAKLVASKLSQESNLRYCGMQATRAVLDCDPKKLNIPNSACVWMGPGAHVVTYWLPGPLLNVVIVTENSTTIKASKSYTQQADINTIKKIFSSWCPEVKGIIELMKHNTSAQWGLFDKKINRPWSNEQVVLLGDAAHPMLPFLAQGGAMAIEDAWTLACSIQSKKTLPDALLHYENQRFARVEKIQKASNSIASTYHRHAIHPLLPFAIPWFLIEQMAPIILKQRLRWLYKAI